MKHTTFSLSIPESCAENWEQMRPRERGRFCSNCQKTVVDFTGFSDAELVAFFSGNKTETVCGRFYVHQIENKIFSYTAPVKRPYRTLAMAASVAALTVLSFTADAQDTKREVPVIPPITVGIHAPAAESSTDTFTIEGVVKDKSGELILSASVQVFSNNKLIGGTATDLDGAYEVSPLQFNSADTISIKCSFVGYETIETILRASDIRDTTKVNFILGKPKPVILRGSFTTGLLVRRQDSPLIDKNKPGGSTVIPASSLEKMPR